MMFGADAKPGAVTVVATEGRGHTPEELAAMALDRILYISKDMPEPIREQAMAYQERIRNILVHYLHRAQRSEMTTLNSALIRNGLGELAQSVRQGEL